MNPILDDIILIPYPGKFEECCMDINGGFSFIFYIFSVGSEYHLERHTIDTNKITHNEELLMCIKNEDILQDKYFLANYGQDFCKMNLKCEFKVIPAEFTIQIKASLFDHILKFETVQDKFGLHLT